MKSEIGDDQHATLSVRDHIAFMARMSAVVFDACTIYSPRNNLTTLCELRILTAIVLSHIQRRDVTVSSLASNLGLNRSTVSKHVSRYVHSGWISERIDPDDRRRRLLEPTEKCMAAAEAWANQIESGRRHVLSAGLPVGVVYRIR